MTKQEFKAAMSAFRKSKRAALFNATDSDWSALINSNQLAKKCKKPEFKPEVSRRVCNYLYRKGGLDAVRHIDSVEIRYN